MTKKINLIYILSQGRSGSTALDLICGKFENVVSLGEIHNLYWDLLDDEKCSCGQTYKKCNFWNNFIQDKYLLKNISKYREKSGSGKRVRFKKLFKIKKIKYDYLVKKEFNYAKENFEFFSEIINKNNLDSNITFIDSSKDPYRLYDLVHSGLFNINIIYIKKRPESWIYSIHKYKERVGIIKILRSVIDYLIDHNVFNIILNKLDQRMILKINYNEIKNEKELIKLLSNFLPHKFNNTHKIHHLVAGNNIKYNFSKFTLDDSYLNSNLKNYYNLIQFFTNTS